MVWGVMPGKDGVLRTRSNWRRRSPVEACFSHPGMVIGRRQDHSAVAVAREGAETGTQPDFPWPTPSPHPQPQGMRGVRPLGGESRGRLQRKPLEMSPELHFQAHVN